MLQYAYNAWGNILRSAQTATGGSAANVVNPFRYRGYYYDTETGLYYLQSRYYNPQWGRFLNADGYVNANGDLIGFNMFAYCSNNPIMYTDSSGEIAIADDLVALGLLALAGVILLIASPVIVDTANKVTESVYLATCDVIDNIQEKIEEINNDHPDEYTVYFLMDDNYLVRYVGRTKNLDARMEQHRKSKKTGDLKLCGAITGLSYCEARGLEEVGIITYSTLNVFRDSTLPQKNYIHGISPFNPNLSAYLRAVDDYLYNRITNDFYN